MTENKIGFGVLGPLLMTVDGAPSAGLGIDPRPTVRALNERVLRQERLDVKRVAMTTAVHGITAPPADRRLRASA